MIFFQKKSFRLVTPLTESEFVLSNSHNRTLATREQEWAAPRLHNERDEFHDLLLWLHIVASRPLFDGVCVRFGVCVRLDESVREFSVRQTVPFKMNECELERVARNVLHCHCSLVYVVIIWNWWCACACTDYQHHSAQTQSVDCWHLVWHLICHCPSSVPFHSIDGWNQFKHRIQRYRWMISGTMGQKTSVFFSFQFISFFFSSAYFYYDLIIAII